MKSIIRTKRLEAKYPDSLGGRDIIDIKVGTLFRDYEENGYRAIVMRGPANFCAYVGVPLNSKLSGFHYDTLPLDVHGGLTYSKKHTKDFDVIKIKGKKKKLKNPWPKGYHWYGWDYAHSGDKFYFYGDSQRMHEKISRKVDKEIKRKYPNLPTRRQAFREKTWRLGEVFNEAEGQLYQLYKLEQLAHKAWYPGWLKWVILKKRDWDSYYFRRWGLKKLAAKIRKNKYAL